MNCIFQAVTISHFLQLKPSRPFLILEPKMIFTYKTVPLKGHNPLQWHFSQVCFQMFDEVVWKQRLLADQSLAFANPEAVWLPEKGFSEAPGRPQSLFPTGIAAMTKKSFIQLHRGSSIPLSPLVVLSCSLFRFYAADILGLMNADRNFISLS